MNLNILDMALTFYIRLAKGLKPKVKMFLGLITTFVEVTGGKLVRRAFLGGDDYVFFVRNSIILFVVRFKGAIVKIHCYVQTV